MQEIKNVYGLTPDEANEVMRLMIDAKGAEEKVQAAKDSAARDSGQTAAAKPSGEPPKTTAAPRRLRQHPARPRASRQIQPNRVDQTRNHNV